MTRRHDLAALACRHRRKAIELIGRHDMLLIATSAANVVYSSGYRSMGYDTDPAQRMAVVFDSDDWILVGPTADLWGAQEITGSGFRYSGYGSFVFDHEAALEATATRFELFETFETALGAAIGELSAGKRSIAADTTLPAAACRGLTALDVSVGETMFRTARAIKDGLEIELLRTVTEATERALSTALAQVRAGMTELDLSASITADMIRAGLRPGFVVVTSGPRAAFADAHAAPRRLGAGDLVRIDIGGTLGGYWSDTARTAIVGEPDAELRAINAALAAGQEAGLSLVRPGMTSDAIFHGVVDAVRRAGLGSYRRHHVGHGLGLESHEFPTLGPVNGASLRPGMVINVETPYYRPGWGGLMSEDTLLVTEDGAERFTRLGTDLIILPA